MSIITATEEAEMGKITVRGQSRPKISRTPSQSKSQEWWCMPVIPGTQKARVKRL
jgi:hypothetical protein